MASTSSMASSSSDFPSTSASNEILPYNEENTKQNLNTVNPKVNGTENGEKPASNSLSKDPINKKPPTFVNLFKGKAKKPKPKKPTKENSPNPEEEARKKEEEAKKKEEVAKKKGEENKKEIEAISNSIRADLDSIGKASNRVKRHEKTFEEATKKFEELKGANAKDLREFKRVVKTLKQQISTQDKDDLKEEEALVNQLRAVSTVNAQVANAVQLGMMPNLFTDSDFERTLQFQDFKARYNELNLELKLCLLCFSVFPEDVEIKRRVMVYWWIGEEIVPPRKVRPEESSNQQHWDKFDLRKINPSEIDLTPERWANFYFGMLLEMGFIESAQKKPDPKVDVCKMHPFVRSMLNRIAQKADFFEFDDDGTVNEEFSKSLRACLVHEKKLTEDKKMLTEDKKKLSEDKKKSTEDNKVLEKIHAIFNVDEAILDSKYDSLSNMRNANVLYLGRWKNLGTHHIEIDDTKILNAKSGNLLDGLQNIKNLKFLSLQGISRITELPKSILKLKNLTILDIRACHNLEKIPDDIGCLVNLTHLDMSECVLLDDMPKGISLLTKLQVLCGFVVVESENKNSCTLEDLKGFCHLRKLSVHTGSDEFPTEKDLRALNQFKALRKLTIAWGRGSANTERKKEGTDTGEQGKDEAISANWQNPKIENEGKSTKEANTGAQDNNQTRKEDNKEGKKKGGVASQIRGITETSQESRKCEKGKGILKGATREIVNASELGIQEASTSRQVVFSPEKNKEISVVQEVQPPEQKLDLKGPSKTKWPPNAQGLSKMKKNFKRPLGRLERTISKRFTSPQLDPILPELPSELTKLDLQCLPEKSLNWLRPEKLLGLKKLYIRGGKLSDLGQCQDLEDDTKRKWEEVEELRLKYLDELDMEWRELLELFPKLDYLEKVDCPKLSFFPCDEIGVWTKKKKTIS